MADSLVTGYPQIPPETERDRREAFRKLWESNRHARFVWHAALLMQISLVEGHQWILDYSQSRTTSKGRTVFQVLPDNATGGPDEVRITLNLIKDKAEELAALGRVAPDGWKGFFEPDDRNATTSNLELALARAIWDAYLLTIPLSEEAGMANEWRVQCGSGLLKAVPDSLNPFGWSIINKSLDCAVWDPAIALPNFSQHYQFADSMAWPAEEVERRYGVRFPEKDKLPTLGTLRGFDTAAAAVRSQSIKGFSESKTPAVILTEYFSQNWQWLTIFVHTGATENQMQVVWDGPNPYGACPYLKWNFGKSLVAPWGLGIGARVRGEQQLFNLAATHIVRHMLTTSHVPWIYEEGTVTDPARAFSPRVGGLIGVKRTRAEPVSIIPQRAQPPNLNAIADKVVAEMPALLSEKLHFRPVMQGVTSPRGESGDAIREKLSQAGRVFEQQAEEDGESTKRFLTHHVMFLCNKGPRKALFDAVGPHLQNVLMEQWQRAGATITTNITLRLPDGSIQPRTRAEKKQDLKDAVALKALDPRRLIWELYKATGDSITSGQAAAVTVAASENRMLIEGAAADQIGAVHFENHDVHISVHKELLNLRHLDPRMTPDVEGQTALHINEHFIEWGDEFLLQYGLDAEASGQAGAVAQVESEIAGGGSPQQGAMVAPTPAPAQYRQRNMQAAVTAQQ